MPLIYSNAMYSLIFILLFLSWCISELGGPARWRGSKEAKRRDRGSTLVLATSTGTGVLCFFLFPAVVPKTTVTPLAPLMFFCGALILVVGTALRWWAIRVLGRYFTGSVVLETTQQLVQSGPYSCIRHPAYAGILLVVFGFGLMTANWASLLSITVGMCVGLLYRISVEEKALTQHFGEAYRAYMARTKRLIPFLV